MPDAHMDGYVLFSNHTDGMQMYQALRKRGIDVRISPAPRAVSVCCGMSLLLKDADEQALRAAAESTGVAFERVVSLPRQIDPRRDVYC